MQNQNLNQVQPANYPQDSFDEVQAVKIQWHPQIDLGPMPNWMPVTQDDRDHLGDVRNKKLRQLKNMAIVAIILSIVSIGIGIGAVKASAPFYYFPHSMAGGCIIGIVVIFDSLMILCLILEGKKTLIGDETTSCFRCLTIFNTVYTTLLSCAALGVVGMAGVWGTVECAIRTPEDDTAGFTSNSCTPRSGSLYALAVMTLLLGSVLFGLFIAMHCVICCNSRAFGIKSNYERFADYQMSRIQHMHLQTQQPQQQRPFLPQQGQGHYYHHGNHPSPSAPMLSEYGSSHEGDALPPSYSDGMRTTSNNI